MIDTQFIESHVKKVYEQMPSECICQFTKEEFSKFLSAVLSEILNSDEFMNYIDAELANRYVRHNRGRR